VLFALALAPVAVDVAAAPQASLRTVANDDWCRDQDGDSRRERYCEVREATWPAAGRIDVDASPNGGIEVTGWDRQEVHLEVKVVATADTEAEARELTRRVQVETTGTIRATGPRGTRDSHWWASYRLSVPKTALLALRSMNGGLSARNVVGTLQLETMNGGIDLANIGGSVRGRTTNGGLNIHLEGSGWSGDGMDLTTTNGGVTLSVPENYNARVETGTTNGELSVDFPITLQGRINRKHLSFDVGRGGPLIRAVTTNGGIEVRKR
jgi:hypothetical protein